MSKKDFKFSIKVQEKYMHPTISLVSYISNIVRNVFKSMKFQQSITVSSANEIDVVIEASDSTDLENIAKIVNKLGKVIQNKIPMNKLVGDNEKNVISLKKLLDLIFVELHILSEIELQDSEGEPDTNKLKEEIQEYLSEIGGLLENVRHGDDKTI